MPLSEDEQRILSEIEDQLYETDPALAREVGRTTVFTHPARNLRLAVLGCIVGLIFMILTLSTSFWLSFVGFLVMLAAALWAWSSLRKLGRFGMQQISDSINRGEVSSFLRSPGRRIMNRMRRDDTGRN
ncbi:MAG: DUF3040 domain-containing protein [bacterium]|nr:DUF3040 domain-containing protein [bacterium]MCY4164084.1 DUF3040 domain-containing protein [bacterium]MCY4256978.1 DUF3040 domain-containing protein [bacterium]